MHGKHLLSQGIHNNLMKFRKLLFDRIKELEDALKEREEQIVALSKVEEVNKTILKDQHCLISPHDKV